MAGNNSFMTSLLALHKDDKFMKDVTSKQSSTTEEVDVKDYLSLIEEILDPEGEQRQSKSSTSLSIRRHAPCVNELCCQIAFKALHTNDARQTTESLLNKLSSFSWDAKAVLTLSALSANYAENWHLVQNEKSDHKLGLAAALRGHRAGKLDLEALKNLIRMTLEFTKCTVEFENYSRKLGAPSTSIDIGARYYQIIVGVIGCSVPFSGMISGNNELQGLDLSPSSKWVKEKYESFKKDVEDFKQTNEDLLRYKEIKELYKSRTDIPKLMASLFCTEKDSPTVNHGLQKTTVKVEQLQNKNVMLLISGLALSDEDLTTLTSIYHDGRFKSISYEIMWVPIADVMDDQRFQEKRSRMPWYSCISIVCKAAAKFIRKFWQFKQRTKVVVLNEKREVVNMDAMPMIRIWGLKASPFTTERADELWKEHHGKWLKLVVNNTVLESVEQSFQSEELILFYSSAKDSDTAKEIKDSLSKIETYVTFKIFSISTKRNQLLSRLENCISLKVQVSTKMFDPLTLEVLQLYTSYKYQNEFAIVAWGSSVIVITSVTDLLKVLSEHKQWITKVTGAGDFGTPFREYCKKITTTPQCYQLSMPNTIGNIPECVKCPTGECTQNMEAIIVFRCCHGEH